MEHNLIVLCGAPASGKSTYSEYYKDDDDTAIISRDAIRFSLLNDEDEYFSKEKQVLKEFYKNINKSLRTNETTVVDATHINKKSRKKLFNNIKERYDSAVAIFIDTPIDILKERNSFREGLAKVPDSVIDSFYDELEYPSLDEGFDSAYILDEDFHLTMEIL